MASPISISTVALSAEISATGAELVRLQDRTGADLLWDGNPAVWNGRSPLLFPIVGEVAGNRLKVAGKAYEIGRHGFARTSTFALVRSDAASCTWRLESSEATRRQYPFEFRLDVTLVRLVVERGHLVAAGRTVACVAGERDDGATGRLDHPTQRGVDRKRFGEQPQPILSVEGRSHGEQSTGDRPPSSIRLGCACDPR